MKKALDEIAILVMSCDAYEDVANHFFNLKEKFMPWWSSNCYYVNNTKQYKRKNVITINSGDKLNWNGRLKTALRKIPEKYILYMQEDYLIDSPVSEQNIINAIKYMKEKGIWYYKIDNLPKIKKMIDETHSAIPSNVRYGINLLTAIIEKEAFMKMLPKEDCSAWEVETSFLKKVTDRYEYDLKGCVLDTQQIISLRYGVRLGKWDKKVLRHFKKKGYIIDQNGRKTMSFSETARINIVGFISHRLTAKQIRRIKKTLAKPNIKFISKEI